MVCNLVALISIALALGLGYYNHKFIKDRIIAQGRVTGLTPVRGSKGGTNYKIVATFMDRSEQEHVYRSSFASSNPGYKVGDPIRICYLESNPVSCGVYSFGYRYGLSLILAAIAASFWLVAMGYKHGQPVMDSIYQSPPLQ
jgi:uncharacterized protein DUF3592